MSTKAQIKANQQNAQKSTGPQTAEGKNVVSQNAIKHGLFADSVIKGEDPAEYEAFHDKFLAELYPVGMVETLLAERVISLWWRLRRAERMQNQAIDEMIENQIDNPMSKRFNMIKWHAKGVKLGDPRYVIDHLQLGRIASTDWSNCRVLDRMMLYERRIESSMTKMMKELKRYEIMRRIEHEDAGEQLYLHAQTIPKASGFEAATESVRDEAATPKKGDLKKQTQFAPELIGVTPFVKRDYSNIPAGRIEENKANQSQFHLP
ncbi:MAG: hypothetical protein WBC05_10510 [Sedimentisphaerales bacterium]